MERVTMETLCTEKNVRITCEYGNAKATPSTWENTRHHAYRVTLRLGRRTLSTDFFTGIGWNKEPSAADVLSCLVSDASSGEHDSFEDFCSNFGYDTDSRSAESTWKECKRTAIRVRRFLGDDFETFANAEH